MEEGINGGNGIIKLLTCLIELGGKVIQPLLTCANAKAGRKYLQIMSAEIKRHPELEITISPDGLTIFKPSEYNTQPPQTLDQALSLRKDKNRWGVIEKTFEELECDTDVSDEPLDTDTVCRIIELSGDSSDEDIQLFWSKLLTEEVKHPRSVSLRTLEVLRNLSSDEAKLFAKIVQHIFIIDGTYLFLRDDDVSKEFDILLSNLLMLDEAGLLSTMSSLTYTLTFNKNEEENHAYIYNGKYVIVLTSQSEKCVKIKLPVYTLSKAGSELLNILHPNNTYLIAQSYAKMIQKTYKEVDVTLHQIVRPIDKNTNMFHYSLENLI